MIKRIKEIVRVRKRRKKKEEKDRWWDGECRDKKREDY